MSAVKKSIYAERSASKIFLLCFLSYALCYIGRQNLSACLPAMIADGTLDKTLGGYITTAYMMVYGAGQLVMGICGTRIRPELMIGTGLCSAGIMNLLMGTAASPWLMMVLWSFNGLFQSMIWGPMIRIFTDRLPESRRYAAGVNIAPSVPVGTVFAYLIPAIFLKYTNWRVVFFVAGGILLLAFAVWSIGNFSLRKYNAMMDKACLSAREAAEAHQESLDTTKKKHSLPRVIAASGLLFILLCLFCNGALKDAVTAWVPTFFSEYYGMDESMSSLITVIVPVVSVTGAYLSTWLNKQFIHNEVYTGGAMFLITTLCVLGVMVANRLNPMLCAVCLAVGISAMWGANTMFLTMLPYHFAPLGLSSAITGFLNCCGYFASAAFSSIYGIAADRAGWQTMTIIWLCIGVGGILFCLIGGRVWAKKVRLLDAGEL